MRKRSVKSKAKSVSVVKSVVKATKARTKALRPKVHATSEAVARLVLDSIKSLDAVEAPAKKLPKKKKKGQKPLPSKPREEACVPRAASRLELFGGASSRDNIRLGDLADVCVDGHGYHWVLVTKIERAEAGSSLPPRPELATKNRPLTKAEAIAARIAERNAAKRAGEAKAKASKVSTSREMSAAIPIGSRVYSGLLTNDPAPACTGCLVGREFTFRHESIKEVKRAARGLTVEDSVRSLKRYIRDTEHRQRPSSGLAEISMELGISGRTSWHEQDYFADEGVPLTP